MDPITGLTDAATVGAVYGMAKQLLGKTFDVVSGDIAGLYERGRDKILEKMSKKVDNLSDGRSTNLRVTRDVFWNGSFTDEEICAEYFGGILASARSEDGKDDAGVFYTDLIKSLSSTQLNLHYLVYSSFNKSFVADPAKANLNPGDETEFALERIFLSLLEILEITGERDVGRDLHALHSRGLIGNFELREYALKNSSGSVPYISVQPNSLGVQLYAVAYNKLDEWRKFGVYDFGEFASVPRLRFSGKSVESLLKVAGLEDEE